MIIATDGVMVVQLSYVEIAILEPKVDIFANGECDTRNALVSELGFPID